MSPKAGWYLDPTGRHRLRYRDDSGWTAWVADGDDALSDPCGAPSEQGGASWYRDPTGRHRLRYWTGSAWSEHVADEGTSSTVDPPGKVEADPLAALRAPTTTPKPTLPWYVWVLICLAAVYLAGITALVVSSGP